MYLMSCIAMYAHPITYGHYPQSLRSLVGSRLPKFTKAESASLKGSHDFLGVNYYSTHSAEYAAPVSTNRTFYTGVAESRNDSIPINQAHKDSIRIKYHDSHLKVLAY
ncbi:hypothetical protein JHK85_021883 [Glycine max]|nr:hypothetical protein JHK85_021883 [Glycine max]